VASGIFRRSLAAVAAASIAAVLLTAGPAYLVARRLYSESNEVALGDTARAIAAALPKQAIADISSDRTGELRRYARQVAAGSGLRITIVAPDGSVAADSGADPSSMDNHAGRPEIAEALRGRVATASRRSSTVGMELFYAAAPIPGLVGGVSGALRVAADLPALEARLGPARLALALAAIAAALAALAAAALYSRQATRPIARLAAAAADYVSAVPPAAGAPPGRPSRGKPSATGARRPFPAFHLEEGPEEIRLLGRAFGTMAGELAERAASAEADARERRALLDGMSEAVLALDGNLAVRQANPAAATLLCLGSPEAAIGCCLLEAGRSPELEAAAREALERGERIESELALYGKEGERWYQVVASPLGRAPSAVDSEAEAAGLVLVLNDITRLRRLERVRSDFVANVSHELRTPIQVIKGFAESLTEGALGEPERAGRFLGIIERNAERMEAIIEDLLSLARLEQEGERELERRPTAVAAILAAARDSVLPKAEARQVRIELDCDSALTASLNAGLVEQALVNLLDNAVRYSPPGSTVFVTARAGEGGPGAAIEVRDRGPGIPASDLPRIFERFYRVDKGRSRESGGTGLGLAIVKHVAEAHGGSVSAESWEGEGSLFRMTLP